MLTQWTKSPKLQFPNKNETYSPRRIRQTFLTVYNWKFPLEYLRLCYLYFVIFANRHRAYIIFLSQFLWQRWGHEPSSDVRRCCEVPFAVFPPRGRHHFVELHCSRLWIKSFVTIILPIKPFYVTKNFRTTISFYYKLNQSLYFCISHSENKEICKSQNTGKSVNNIPCHVYRKTFVLQKNIKTNCILY